MKSNSRRPSSKVSWENFFTFCIYFFFEWIMGNRLPISFVVLCNFFAENFIVYR